MADRQKLVIDRATWGLKLNSTDKTALLSSTGKKCCLGFAEEQLCEAKPDDIREKLMPHYAPHLKWPGFLAPHGSYQQFDSPVAERLATINDDFSLSSREREKRITDTFAVHDVKVTFINEFPKEMQERIAQCEY